MKTIILILMFNLISLSLFASPKIIIGEDEIEKLKDLDPTSEIYLMSKPTGRLKLPGTLGIPDYCTISLISENEVLTASHCLTKRDHTKMVAYFEYYTKNGKTLNPYPVKLIKLNIPSADVAILQLEGVPGKKYGYYNLAKEMPAKNEALIIFEHPGLDEKSVSRKNCFLNDFDNEELAHTCDTENYSSGAPILNEKYEVIAVHQGSLATDTNELNYGHIIINLINH